MTMFLEKNMSGVDVVYRFALTGLRQIIEKVCNHCRDVVLRVHTFFRQKVSKST